MLCSRMDSDQPFVVYDFLSPGSAKAPTTRKNIATVDVGNAQESSGLSLALSLSSSCDHDEEQGYKKILGISLEQSNNISVELTIGGIYNCASKGNSNIVDNKGKRPLEVEQHNSKSKVGTGISLELSLGFNETATPTTSNSKKRKRRMETHYCGSTSKSTTVDSTANKKTSKVVDDHENNSSSDPWRIKKKLKESDVGHMSRLLLHVEWMESHVFPFWTPDQLARIKQGVPVSVWDCDTRTRHKLEYKRWNNGANVLMKNWNKEFVERRRLNADDEIGLYWDEHSSEFKFSLLNPAPTPTVQQ